jgi:hypothetical protein
MFENKRDSLAPAEVYYQRIGKFAVIAGIVLFTSLLLGVIGYKLTVPEFDWYDSLLNASMILSGMGPVIDANIHLSKGAKIFASAYALFSGVSFLSTFTILLAPITHRFFHKIHLESGNDNAS